jgi:hypothetical protein
MFLWLIENASTICLFLAAVAILLLVAYWKTREHRLLFGVAGAAGLAALIGLIRFFFGGYSDQLQLEWTLTAMRTAVQKRDTAALFQHIASDFHFAGQNREFFRAFVDRHLQNGDVTDVQFWNEERAKVTRPGPDKGRATIEFTVKPKGNITGDWFGQCIATFVLEDGKWRLQTFELRDPVNNQPFQIPHF